MDEITPALTPDEWEKYEGRYYHDIWSGLIHDPRDESNPNRMDAPKLHAAATLALNGQPFGFTREDVRQLGMLRSYLVAQAAQPEAHPGHAAELHERARFTRDLAARIAALLPPED